MKSYIEFKEIPTTTKTKLFHVISKTDGSKLGEIKWHSPYRKYSFQVRSKNTITAIKIGSTEELQYGLGYFSGAFTRSQKIHISEEALKGVKDITIYNEIDTKIFDTTCLDEISQFIKKLMEEKRKK
jgi:hypothetical protein